MQVGDFGYWEHERSGVIFLDRISSLAETTGIPLYFVDGNHENHTMLRGLYGPGGPRHELTEDGFWKIREGLFYIPRATKWTWDYVEFAGLGGAVSTDKVYRLAVENGVAAPEWGYYPNDYDEPKGPETMWWPQEAITDEDVAKAKTLGTVDVLFTHETITGANFGYRLKNDVDSEISRRKMDEVVKSLKPTLMFHGHYHTQMYSEFLHETGKFTKIYGVERDEMNRNWALLDTESFYE